MSHADLAKRHEFLRQQYGFKLEELRYIARLKPNIFMYDKNTEKGMKALSELLIEEYGFKKELVRTLVLKYPSILGMSKGQLRNFFNFMIKSKGID